jgi:transposase
VTIRQVSLQENLLWDVVDDVFTRKATQAIRTPAQVRWLGIDEISLRKGHRNYACVLVDLERACVIDLLPERTVEYLTNYFQSKGEAFLSGVEVFSTDMWKGFVKVAQALMPQALIVVDRFHVVRQLADALDRYRRHLRRKHPDVEELKGIKWLLLKPKEDLSQKDHARLEAAFARFPQLEQCYLLKETLRHWFDHFEDRQEAEHFLRAWITQAQALENRYLNRFLKTLARWKDKILNYFEDRISNGLVEGINHAIRQIKRRAYGYSNFHHFRLRVLLECR